MSTFTATLTPYAMRTAAVIPALNEEHAIAAVVRALPSTIAPVIVADNGSTDRTVANAIEAGATVVHQPRRGYGSACLAALEHLYSLDAPPDAVLFLDADAADDPAGIPTLLTPIETGTAELVVGSRTLGNAEPGSLTLPQRFGNTLACALLRNLFHDARYTDLGPFRIIRADALRCLNMDDRDFGWTVQMQARAAKARLATAEVPVAYRKRIGTSKISGTVRGVILAGTKIIATIARERFHRPGPRTRFLVFARLPAPGRTKTRLLDALTPEEAAALQHDLTKHTLARTAACEHEVLIAHDEPNEAAALREAARLYGPWRTYARQAHGDLGDRLTAAFDHTFNDGYDNVIAIGTDCPDLSHADLVAAEHALDKHPVVLGPAADGGYYLIGFRQQHRARAMAAFDEIPWGSDGVLDATTKRLRDAGLTFSTLRTLADIDRPEDLQHWRRQGRDATRPTQPQSQSYAPGTPQHDA